MKVDYERELGGGAGHGGGDGGGGNVEAKPEVASGVHHHVTGFDVVVGFA